MELISEVDMRNVSSGVTYDFTRQNQISVDYELGRTNQPIFRTDPVDFERLRIRGKFSPAESLRFSGSASLFDHDDDFEAIDFTSRNRDYSFEFTYDPLSRISLSGQYERSRISTNLLYVMPQTFQTDRFLYTERGDYGSLYVSLELIRKSRLNLGYSVWGTVGDFPLTYHQPMAALEIPLGERLVAYGQWNHYDYNEKLQLFPQDYRVHLITFGFRISGKPDDLGDLFRGNRPPRVECLPPNVTVLEGDSPIVQAAATDPDGDDLKITWSTSGGTLRKKDTSATLDSTGLLPGTYTITAEVTDGQYSASYSAEITIAKVPAKSDPSP